MDNDTLEKYLNILTNPTNTFITNNEHCYYGLLDINNESNDEYINEYIKIRFPSLPDNYLSIMREEGKKAYLAYEERLKMNKIYKTTIYKTYKDTNGQDKELSFKLYDMSTLKLQDEMGKFSNDDSYYKEPPSFVLDIERFNHIVCPLDFSTLLLYNKEEKCLLNLKDEKIYNL